MMLNEIPNSRFCRLSGRQVLAPLHALKNSMSLFGNIPIEAPLFEPAFQTLDATIHRASKILTVSNI